MKRLCTLLATLGLCVAMSLAGATSAHARPCLSKEQAVAQHDGHARYRLVQGQQCWYTGEARAEKSEFVIARKSAQTPSAEERMRWFCGDFCGSMIKEQWPKR